MAVIFTSLKWLFSHESSGITVPLNCFFLFLLLEEFEMQTDAALLCVPQQGTHLDTRLNIVDAQMISADIILQCHFQVIEHTKPPATRQTRRNLLWVQNASKKQDERICDTKSCCIYLLPVSLVPHCCTMQGLACKCL